LCLMYFIQILDSVVHAQQNNQKIIQEMVTLQQTLNEFAGKLHDSQRTPESSLERERSSIIYTEEPRSPGNLLGHQGIDRAAFKVENNRKDHNSVPSFKGSPLFGKGEGDNFTDIGFIDLTHNTDITKFIVNSGHLIDGIQFFYGNQPGKHHGGPNGFGREVTLQPGEKIIQVAGREGTVIDALSFTTNKGRTFSFGGNGGKEFSYTAGDGYYLAAIKGFDPYQVCNEVCNECCSQSFLARIGFIFKKIE